MASGYTGKILEVNLTSRTIHEMAPDGETLRKYIGGSGLGARILYDRTGPDTDPLGPENLLS